MVSQPKPPDPAQTASAQQAANVGGAAASAIINNANERNPYGSVTYNQIGTGQVTDAQGKPMSVPRYERVTELSPEQQNLLRLQTGMQTNLGELGVSQSGRLQDLLGSNLDTSGIEDWNRGTAPVAYDRDAYSADRKKVEDATYNRYLSQVKPQREAQEATLAARGLSPGGAGYGGVQEGNARADTDASMAAILAGGQEQSRMLGEERAGWQQGQDYSSYLNNLRGAQFGEKSALRNAPINEIAALMSGSQVSVPSFQPFSRQGVDSAPIGQYIQQNYAAKANAAANTNAGIFGLANAGIGALPFMSFGSDRRLKRNIRKVGKFLAGLPLYWFNFVKPLCFKPGYEGIQIGVMSDEVRKLHPDAVHEFCGFDVVDYGLLLRRH